MIKNGIILFSALFLTTAYSQDAWLQRDSLNGPPRANACSFVIGDDGFVIAGYDGSSKKRSAVSYDIDQDDWDNEASLGGESGDGLNRSSAIAFNAWGYGFVGLGEGTGFMFTDLWMYDKYTNTWTQMATFIGGARTQAVSFMIDQIGYVGLGKDDDFTTLLNDFYKYDYTTNSWSQIADFPGTGRMDAVAVAMGGKGYVGLGYDGTSMPTDFYEYYPVTDTWVQKADFPGTPRINATGFGVFPQLFITTGDDGFNYLNDTWEYNYFGDAWTQRADFPGAGRSGAISVVIEDRPFVGTGYGDGIYYDDFYEYGILLSTVSENGLNFKVYPNPASEIINIALPFPSIEQIEIYDLSGKRMSDQFEFITSTNTIQIINISALQGVYMIALTESNEKIHYQKVILN